MFRLTREVRFALNADDDAQLREGAANGYGGHPSLTRLGYYLTSRVTLEGELESRSQYLVNIKRIDESVRDAVPALLRAVRDDAGYAGLLAVLHGHLRSAWRDKLRAVTLAPSPYLTYAVHSGEPDMMRLSQTFEFSASHRLHNPALTDAENRATFGKCNNPLSHGHNYEVQVTVSGAPGANAQLLDVPAFERVVAEAAIDRVDHKYLNAEVAEFAETIPSVENIAKVIYGWLKPRFAGTVRLASVTVWETPKTWCEYSE